MIRIGHKFTKAFGHVAFRHMPKCTNARHVDEHFGWNVNAIKLVYKIAMAGMQGQRYVLGALFTTITYTIQVIENCKSISMLYEVRLNGFMYMRISKSSWSIPEIYIPSSKRTGRQFIGCSIRNEERESNPFCPQKVRFNKMDLTFRSGSQGLDSWTRARLEWFLRSRLVQKMAH